MENQNTIEKQTEQTKLKFPYFSRSKVHWYKVVNASEMIQVADVQLNHCGVQIFPFIVSAFDSDCYEITEQEFNAKLAEVKGRF